MLRCVTGFTRFTWFRSSSARRRHFARTLLCFYAWYANHSRHSCIVVFGAGLGQTAPGQVRARGARVWDPRPENAHLCGSFSRDILRTAPALGIAGLVILFQNACWFRRCRRESPQSTPGIAHWTLCALLARFRWCGGAVRVAGLYAAQAIGWLRISHWYW